MIAYKIVRKAGRPVVVVHHEHNGYQFPEEHRLKIGDEEKFRKLAEAKGWIELEPAAAEVCYV